MHDISEGLLAGNHVMYIRKNVIKNRGHRARFFSSWMTYMATFVITQPSGFGYISSFFLRRFYKAARVTLAGGLTFSL